jgi:hypothetical protein
MKYKYNLPTSLWITKKGCIIQGVMNDESEINTIWCPTHKQKEFVHTFDRETSLRGRPSKAECELAKRLQKGEQF